MTRTEISNNISACSFVCAVMVVFRHSLNYSAFFGEKPIGNLNLFIQGGTMALTEVAVPFFFTVSGFFFFRTTSYSFISYIIMLKKKAKGLLIPFLIWGFGGVVVSYLIDKNLFINAYNTFVNCLECTYYPPLWYIRDLMLFMFFSPLYCWLFKRKLKIYLIGILVFLFFAWVPVDCRIFSTEGCFFFILGGFIQNTKIKWVEKSRILLLFLTLTWVFTSYKIPLWEFGYLHKTNTLLGVLVLWHLIEIIPSRIKEKLVVWSNYSFIVYCSHFYILKIFKITTAYFFFNNQTIAAISFVFLPVIVTVLIIMVFRYLSQQYRPLYNIITGNR